MAGVIGAAIETFTFRLTLLYKWLPLYERGRFFWIFFLVEIEVEKKASMRIIGKIFRKSFVDSATGYAGGQSTFLKN